jgi:hypothetical protein
LRHRVGRTGWDDSFHAGRLEHPIHNPLHTALSGGWHGGGLLPESLGRACPPCTLGRDASLQSLQSTYCHGNSIDRPALELGACTPATLATYPEPRTRHACTERNTSRPRRRGLAIAGITCLEWRTGLAPSSPAVGRKPPPLGMPGCPDMTHAGIVNPCTSRDNGTTDVSCHHLARPGCPGHPRGLGPFPHAVHQHRSFPSPETPSTHGSW